VQAADRNVPAGGEPFTRMVVRFWPTSVTRFCVRLLELDSMNDDLSKSELQQQLDEAQKELENLEAEAQALRDRESELKARIKELRKLVGA
jgi:peptidoglycan hydrolase CwlO-like protein